MRLKYLLLILPFMWGCAEKKTQTCLTLCLEDFPDMRVIEKIGNQVGCISLYSDSTYPFGSDLQGRETYISDFHMTLDFPLDSNIVIDSTQIRFK